jgi:hypothetical protein
VKQNKKRSYLDKNEKHKENLNGKGPLLLSHMERPHKMFTIRDRAMKR